MEHENSHKLEETGDNNTSEEKTETPKRVSKPFLMGGGTKIFSPRTWGTKEAPIEELMENVLFLIRQDGYIDMIENVQPGEFLIQTKTKEGTTEEKSIWLTQDKLLSFRYNNLYFRSWIAHENIMSALPEDPSHNAEIMRKVIQKLALNYKDLNEIKYQQARTKMWMMIIGGILLGLVLLSATPFGKDLFSSFGNQAVDAGVEVAKNVTKNITENVTSVVVR